MRPGGKSREAEWRRRDVIVWSVLTRHVHDQQRSLRTSQWTVLASQPHC